MPNTLLTPQIITREGLRVLHQKLNFIGNVNRQYDDRFAQTGAKIGSTLNIRMPAKYNVRTGPGISVQDHVERSTPLAVTSQYGVDVSFTTVEMTMSLDDFSKRVLEPAMAQLASRIEADALTAAYRSVNNYTNATTDGLLNYKRFQQGGRNMTENLAPSSERTAILTPASIVEFNDAVKGLFQSSQNIAAQYREGIMGRTGGFDVYENTLLPAHTNGTLAGSAVTNGTALGTSTTANAWVSQTTLAVDGATSGTTLRAGDVITLSGVFDVHPETKVSTGKLKTFVVQSDVTLTTSANSYDVVVRPGLIYGAGNGFRNAVLSGVANTDGLTITRIGAANTAFGQDLQFHKDAFVFATADLIDVSQYGAKGARESMDGISMRWAQQYDIGTDTVAGRFDILWGFAPLYPELANRHMYTLSLA